MKKRKNHQSKAYRLNERILFVLLLAIAGGATIFLVFLSSKDMKGAQTRVSWAQQIDTILDRIAADIANSAEVNHPFSGASEECWFHRSNQSGALEPSMESVGFSFSDSGLSHKGRNASGTGILKEYQGHANPLISGVQSGKFERLGVRLLRLNIKVSLPDQPDSAQEFDRKIFLRNQ